LPPKPPPTYPKQREDKLPPPGGFNELQPGIREARPEHLFFFVVLLVDNARSKID
jgi:hypothetical protein